MSISIGGVPVAAGDRETEMSAWVSEGRTAPPRMENVLRSPGGDWR